MTAAIKLDISNNTYNTSNTIAPGLEVKNFIYPGAWQDENSFSKLLHDMDIINNKCITTLKYGLFNPKLNIEQRRTLLQNAFVVISYYNDQPIAANHGYIYTDNKLDLPIIYFGLTQNNSGLKMDLTGTMHMLTVNLLSMHYNEAMVSTITIHPRIAETMDLLAENVFPSPHYKSKRPPKGYREYAEKVVCSYAVPFWSSEGQVHFNNKDFTLSLEGKESTGYTKENIEDIVKAEDWMYDLYFQHKLNWDKNEDMLLIGRLTNKSFTSVKQQLALMAKK